MGRKSKKRGYVYMYNWFALLYSKNEHNIIKQLHSNNLKKKKKRDEGLGRTEESPEGPVFCPAAYTWGSAVLLLTQSCDLLSGSERASMCSRDAPGHEHWPSESFLQLQSMCKARVLQNNHIRQWTRDGTFHSSGMLLGLSDGIYRLENTQDLFSFQLFYCVKIYNIKFTVVTI